MWQSGAKNAINELNDNLIKSIEQSGICNNLYEAKDSPISAKQITSLQFEWQLKRKM